MRTAEVILAGRKFVVSSFSWRDVERLMGLYLGLQKALESKPLDIGALLNFRAQLTEFLYRSVHRAQPEVTLEELDDLEPDVLMSGIVTAIEISSPPKHSLSQLTGSRPN